MELKMKENVRVKSFTFKKRVMEETKGLKNTERNYTDNDINFYVMIAFLNNLFEGNVILETIATNEDLESTIEQKIEPLYIEYILNNEDNLESFNSIVEDLKHYYEREVENKHYGVNLIYDLLDELGNLDQAAIIDVARKMGDYIKKTLLEEKEKDNNSTPTITKEDLAIQSEKMKELIEKYKSKE